MATLISMLMPTRARPDLALRFLESAYKTCRDAANVEIIIIVDDDDDTYEGFVSPFEKTTLKAVSPLTMSGYNRFAAKISSGDILMLVNDDIIVESEGWDVAVRNMHAIFPDELYLGFPNDGFKGSRLSVFPILSRRTFHNFNVLPDIYSGAFIDTHLHEVFHFLKTVGHDRICYLENVRFTHHHYRVTKEAPDETYKRRDRFGDDLTFLHNVKVRHCVSLSMRDYIQAGNLCSVSGSADVLDGVMAPFSYYLFACPGHLGYRIRMVSYLFARLIFNHFSKLRRYCSTLTKGS